MGVLAKMLIVLGGVAPGAALALLSIRVISFKVLWRSECEEIEVNRY